MEIERITQYLYGFEVIIIHFFETRFFFLLRYFIVLLSTSSNYYKMTETKIIILTSVFFFHVNSVNAQHMLEESDFRKVTTDSVCIQSSEYFAPGISGKDVVWDLSYCNLTGKDIDTSFNNVSDSVITCLRGKKLSSFVLRDGLLCLVGEESPYYKIKYSRPLVKMQFPVCYGDSLYSSYESRGLYWGTHHTITVGEVIVKADGYGKVHINDDNTIDDVMRLHILQTASTQMHMDSCLVDKAPCRQEIVEQYFWFAKGEAYPILETELRTSYFQNDIIANRKKACIHMPESILNQVEIVERMPLDSLTVEKDEICPLISHVISVKDKRITIDYSVSERCPIRAIVCTMTGVVLHDMQVIAEAFSPSIITIDCNTQKAGTYVLYLNVNGNIISKVVNIQ